MIEIIVKNQEEFEKHLKIFIKKVQRSGILQEVKNRRYYNKPSEEKRLKKRKK